MRQRNLVMFYTGDVRSANTILAEQKKNIGTMDKTANLLKMCELAREMHKALESDDLSSFGDLLNEGWRLKQTLASGISNPGIDEAYEIHAADFAFLLFGSFNQAVGP